MNATTLMSLADVDCTGGGSDEKNKDQLTASEELQHINDEFEKEYVFALKKVGASCRVVFVENKCLYAFHHFNVLTSCIMKVY